MGNWVYLGVFVYSANTVCGFFVILFYMLDRGSKTVILIYDTWASVFSIVCICGYVGVFGCICGFYKYDLWMFCDFFLYPGSS